MPRISFQLEQIRYCGFSFSFGFSFCFGLSFCCFFSFASGFMGAGCGRSCCAGRASDGAGVRSGCARSFGLGASGCFAGSFRLDSGRFASGLLSGVGRSGRGELFSGRATGEASRSGCERSFGEGVSARGAVSFLFGSGRLFGSSVLGRAGSGRFASGLLSGVGALERAGLPSGRAAGVLGAG